MQVSTDQAVQWRETMMRTAVFFFNKRQKALLDVIDYHIYEDKEGFQAALKKSKTDFVVTQIGWLTMIF